MNPYFHKVFTGYLLLFFGVVSSFAQNTNDIEATLQDEDHTIAIKQRFVYQNNSNDVLDTLFFNDWNNAYSSKKSALARRFADEFNKSLHLANEKQRGFTKIKTIVDKSGKDLVWSKKPIRDILKIVLNVPLRPGEEIEILFDYLVDLPNSKFTGYGHGYKGGYFLRDWYLTPALYDTSWKLYPNENLDDQATNPMNTEIRFKFPTGLNLGTNFNTSEATNFSQGNFIKLTGKDRKNCTLILTPKERFSKHTIGSLTFVTDIEHKKYDNIQQAVSMERIAKFIEDHLGPYPHGTLLVAEYDYKRNPLFDLNFLPSFLQPYREQFRFEMEILKTSLNSYVKETLYLDERKDRWVYDAIVNYLMIKYVWKFYPDQKFTGKLSKFWGFRSYNMAKLDFNDQYYLLQMTAVRRNDHQSIHTANDSLTRYNQRIANRYKAGLGLAYLGEYTSYDAVDRDVKEFYESYNLKPDLKAKFFEDILQRNSNKDINWFFREYVEQRNNIDFKIKKVKKNEDSITVQIKNKTGSKVPISLFGLQKDSVISKYWFSNIDSTRTVTIPNNDESRLVLNYDKKIPEVNQRDNWKSTNGFFSSNKKFQLRFFKDVENPYYNQLFWVPEFSFNVNNGISLGISLNNKTFNNRKFTFSIKPKYSGRENALIGGVGFTKRHFYNEGKLNEISYSLGYGNGFFAENSRVSTFTPSFRLRWRPENFLSNRRQFLFARIRNVFRNIDPSVQGLIDTEPDFSVFNMRYGDVNNNILKYRRWVIDAQVADKFTKVSFEWEHRTLYFTNRQLNLRLYAGKFITNTSGSDFFSFALDRPTDYLFDLGYLNNAPGATGLSSQQFILAEGGFKSIFEDRFADDFIVTGNLSFNLWRWIEVYGDVGAIKDRGDSVRFRYDSGVRLNLVTDFFELYFPVYSNNGYEIAQPNYEDRIRFVITISPRTLTGLFTRKWF